MISNEERIRAAIAEQASEWFVANDERQLGEQESAALAAWLKASPMHIDEFLRVSVIARDLNQACSDPELSIDALVARARAEDDGPVEPLWSRVFTSLRDVPAHRWQSAAVAAAGIGALALGLLLWNPRPTAQVAVLAVAALHFETRHGEQQTQRLADGSVLHLNTDSAVTVRYSPTERLVLLTSGEAEFEVAHAPERPFRVFAGAAEVVAIGTRFDVRLRNDVTVVTVVEGRVAVGRPASPGSGAERPDPAGRFVELNANQQITVEERTWPVNPVAVDPQRPTAWLRRQIMFEQEPLGHVASEFNRYTSKPIEIASPQLRALEISGVFATDNSAAFIAFLRSLGDVQVEVTDTQIVVSQK
jgi:transmembrane sensor